MLTSGTGESENRTPPKRKFSELREERARNLPDSDGSAPSEVSASRDKDKEPGTSAREHEASPGGISRKVSEASASSEDDDESPSRKPRRKQSKSVK